MVHECGIRLGEAVQQDMIAMRLTRPFKAILVASKAYVDAKGAPKTIGDLRDHNCIGFRMVGSGGVYAWELSDGGKVAANSTIRLSRKGGRNSTAWAMLMRSDLTRMSSGK